MRCECVGHGLSLHPDVDAAAEADQPAVAAPRGFGGGRIVLGNDEMRRVALSRASWSRPAKLWSRSENCKPALGVEAGVLQRALELLRVAAQEVERLGALDQRGAR